MKSDTKSHNVKKYYCLTALLTHHGFMFIRRLLEMFCDEAVREFLFLLGDVLLPTDSRCFLRSFSKILQSWFSTSPKYGRLTGSPSQQLCINCQQGSENVGSLSGRNPVKMKCALKIELKVSSACIQNL